MKRRLLTILFLHVVALLFMGLSYSSAHSRPFNAPEPEPPPYLAALPLANSIPPPLKPGPEEIGVGTKKFHRPGVAGIRLDWCAGPGPHLGCGPPAAQLFCQYQGFSRAVSMVEEQGVGLQEQTRRIASNTSCNGPDCSGFLAITCSQK